MTAARLKELRRQLRETRREMRLAGIKRTSCFNGGMTRKSQRFNERCFALETEITTLHRSLQEKTP